MEIGQIFHNKYIFNGEKRFKLKYCSISNLQHGNCPWWNNPLICKASPKENWTGQYPVWIIQKPRKGVFRVVKSKKFPCGAYPRPPPRSLHLWLLFRKLVSSYPRCVRGIEHMFGKSHSYIWLNKPAEILPRNFSVTFILMWTLPCQHQSFPKQRKRNLLK